MRSHMLIRGFAAAAALALPGVASAQDPNAEGYDPEPVDVGAPTLDVDARAGVAVPVGDLREYSQPGFAVGLGASWWLTDALAIRADGALSALTGDDEAGAGPATPNMQLYHYGLGLELDLSPNRVEGPWDLGLNVGAGGTTLDTEAFLDDGGGAETDLTNTYPNVNGGVEVGRRVGENIVVSLSGQAFYTFVDEEELTPLSDLRAAGPIEAGVDVPVTLSIRWDLPRMDMPGTGN